MVHEIQSGDRRTDSGALVIGSRLTVRNPKNHGKDNLYTFNEQIIITLDYLPNCIELQ